MLIHAIPFYAVSRIRRRKASTNFFFTTKIKDDPLFFFFLKDPADFRPSLSTFATSVIRLRQCRQTFYYFSHFTKYSKIFIIKEFDNIKRRGETFDSNVSSRNF